MSERFQLNYMKNIQLMQSPEASNVERFSEVERGHWSWRSAGYKWFGVKLKTGLETISDNPHFVPGVESYCPDTNNIEK